MKRKITLKRKLRADTSRRRRTKTSAAAKIKVQAPDVMDMLVSASAQTLKLPIDPAWYGGIKFNLQLILRLAALVDEFPLPDETEPAPVFHA